MERWRQPVIPLNVEEDPYTIVDFGDGVARRDVTYTLTEEDTERVRLGYVCLQCLEPHERPFPERCSDCGYPMKERQPRDFERNYEGNVRMDLGARRIKERLAALEEEARRPAASILVPGTPLPKSDGGVILPKGVKNDA